MMSETERCCKNCKYIYTILDGYSCANGDSYYEDIEVKEDDCCQQFLEIETSELPDEPVIYANN